MLNYQGDGSLQSREGGSLVLHTQCNNELFSTLPLEDCANLVCETSNKAEGMKAKG